MKLAIQALNEVAERLRWGDTVRDWERACRDSLVESRKRRMRRSWWLVADVIIGVAIAWAIITGVIIMATLAQRI